MGVYERENDDKTCVLTQILCWYTGVLRYENGVKILYFYGMRYDCGFCRRRRSYWRYV